MITYEWESKLSLYEFWKLENGRIFYQRVLKRKKYLFKASLVVMINFNEITVFWNAEWSRSQIIKRLTGSRLWNTGGSELGPSRQSSCIVTTITSKTVFVDVFLGELCVHKMHSSLVYFWPCYFHIYYFMIFIVRSNQYFHLQSHWRHPNYS